VNTDEDRLNCEFSLFDGFVTTAQVRENVDYLCLTTAMILDYVSRATCHSYFPRVWTIYRIVAPNVSLY